MSAPIDRAQILSALQLSDPSTSCYLDLETGTIIRVDDTATDEASETQRNEIMEGYGDRYRYVSGGNPTADDSAVQAWIEGEGL